MTATKGSKPAEVSAVAPADAAAVPSLIKELGALGQDYSAASTEQLRLTLLQKAKALWQALETPRETMIRHCWAQVS